jgi:CO dehydrogenase/acetyl-CoA synthase beta subunit
VFEAYIRKVAEYVEDLRARGRQIREFEALGTAAVLREALPVNVGPLANQGVILREDTFVELGGPDAGSCAFFLMTDDLSLIRDGRTTLIGPDIQETSCRSLPFCQVVMIGGTELGEGEHETLQQIRFIGDQIEGYMVRSLSRGLWSRVSRNAAAKGFGFEVLGRTLMAIYKSQNPRIQATEILFVTSSKEDVMILSSIETQVQKIGKEVQKKNWKIRGYDIDCALDCEGCADKAVCDEIREVLRMRKRTAEDFGSTTT